MAQTRLNKSETTFPWHINCNEQATDFWSTTLLPKQYSVTTTNKVSLLCIRYFQDNANKLLCVRDNISYMLIPHAHKRLKYPDFDVGKGHGTHFT